MAILALCNSKENVIFHKSAFRIRFQRDIFVYLNELTLSQSYKDSDNCVHNVHTFEIYLSIRKFVFRVGGPKATCGGCLGFDPMLALSQ